MSIIAGRPALPNPDIPGTLLIPLTKGYFAIIDEADSPVISSCKWQVRADDKHSTAYAMTSTRRADRTLTTIAMHLVLWRLWGLPPCEQLDHENRNGLDNRRLNLRPATKAENMSNVGPFRNNSSGFKGVSWCSDVEKWQADITARGSRLVLGRFETPEAAARAYDEAARRLHGEFAYQNFPEAEGA